MKKGMFVYNENEARAFKQHYHELVKFDTPFAFMLDYYMGVMEKYGKPMFKVPKEFSLIEKDLIFVFDKKPTEIHEVYYYKHVIADRKIIKRYKPERTYPPI